MADNEKTSPEVADLAAKGLRYPGLLTHDQIQSVCASALTQVADTNTVSESLLKTAKELCPDYPFGESPTQGDCLWAISSAMKGTLSANADCHRFIKVLGGKLGYGPDDLIKIWESLEK